MFSSVVSCSVNRPQMRLVASSIRAMSWHAGPRSSNQRNGERSCITNSPLALQKHGFHALGARTPQRRLGPPFPQCLSAHPETLLGQVFGGQRGSEIRITLAHTRQSLLREPPRQRFEADRAVGARANHPHARESAAAFAAPGDRLPSGAPLLLLAKDFSA